jgi:hypothetical protein
MASSSSEPELTSEQEIIGRFQDMRRQMTGLVTNLQTLEAGEETAHVVSMVHKCF